MKNIKSISGKMWLLLALIAVINFCNVPMLKAQGTSGRDQARTAPRAFGQPEPGGD